MHWTVGPLVRPLAFPPGVAAPRAGEDYSLKYISIEFRKWFQWMDGCQALFLEPTYNTAPGVVVPRDVEPPRHWLQHPLFTQEQSIHGVYNLFRWDRGLGRPLETYTLKMRAHRAWHGLCFRVMRAAAHRLNSIVFQAWHTSVQLISASRLLCRCRVGLGPELRERITSFLEPDWTIRLLGWEWELEKGPAWLDELDGSSESSSGYGLPRMAG